MRDHAEVVVIEDACRGVDLKPGDALNLKSMELEEAS